MGSRGSDILQRKSWIKPSTVLGASGNALVEVSKWHDVMSASVAFKGFATMLGEPLESANTVYT